VFRRVHGSSLVPSSRLCILLFAFLLRYAFADGSGAAGGADDVDLSDNEDGVPAEGGGAGGGGQVCAWSVILPTLSVVFVLLLLPIDRICWYFSCNAGRR
jgi:hypothetical protein